MTFTEITSFGTVDPTGATSSTVTFQAARDGVSPGEPVFVGVGKYDITELTGTGENIWYCNGATNLAQTGLPRLPGIVMGHFQNRFVMDRRKSTDTDVATFHSIRNANHTGGTNGFVNTSGLFESIVSSGVTNFEWCLLSNLTNNSTSGENVSSYFLSSKNVDGSTWASVFNLTDYTSDPTTSSVTTEFDFFGNGTDSHGTRIMADFALGKRDSMGTIPTIQHYTRFSTVNGDMTQGQVKIAHLTDGNITDTAYKVTNHLVLGGTTGNTSTAFNFGQYIAANVSFLKAENIRTSSGTDWQTSTLRLSRSIDSTLMGNIDFRGKSSFGFSVAMGINGVDFLECDNARNETIFAKPTYHNTYLTLQEQGSNPSAPASGTELRIYPKADKIVFQWNDSGTTRYLTATMSGTSATWTKTTTAP